MTTQYDTHCSSAIDHFNNRANCADAFVVAVKLTYGQDFNRPIRVAKQQCSINALHGLEEPELWSHDFKERKNSDNVFRSSSYILLR